MIRNIKGRNTIKYLSSIKKRVKNKLATRKRGRKIVINKLSLLRKSWIHPVKNKISGIKIITRTKGLL